MTSPSSVLIAGGAGFVGSHLVERLLRDGARVTVVDDFSTGHRSNLEFASTATTGTATNSRLRTFDHNIIDSCWPDDLGRDFQLIFHLASPAAPPAYLGHPIETLLAGSQGTHNLLEVARASRARFVLASTSEVYGDPAVRPQPETYWGNVNPVGERSVYDEAKRFAEAMTAAYQRVHGLSVGIARIFNTYGPRMRVDDGRVVSNMLRQALHGEPLTVYGDGRQTRSFCYIDDLIDGLIALAYSTHRGPINLGNDNEIEIAELAAMIAEIVGVPVDLDMRALPADDPRHRQPDLTLARALLGFDPKIDLPTGLRKMLTHSRHD